jgi:hypothetical protein
MAGEMDVSISDELCGEGQELLDLLVKLTGLPEGSAETQLMEILEIAGVSKGQKEKLSIDQLRHAFLVYLQAMQTDTQFDASQKLPS